MKPIKLAALAALALGVAAVVTGVVRFDYDLDLTDLGDKGDGHQSITTQPDHTA